MVWIVFITFVNNISYVQNENLGQRMTQNRKNAEKSSTHSEVPKPKVLCYHTMGTNMTVLPRPSGNVTYGRYYLVSLAVNTKC